MNLVEFDIRIVRKYEKVESSDSKKTSSKEDEDEYTQEQRNVLRDLGKLDNEESEDLGPNSIPYFFDSEVTFTSEYKKGFINVIPEELESLVPFDPVLGTDRLKNTILYLKNGSDYTIGSSLEDVMELIFMSLDKNPLYPQYEINKSTEEDC